MTMSLKVLNKVNLECFPNPKLFYILLFFKWEKLNPNNKNYLVKAIGLKLQD